MIPRSNGHLEVVGVLLGHPSAKATINRRGHFGQTALGWACYLGSGARAMALLESGADSTTADNNRTTPVATAKRDPPIPCMTDGRRECVVVLEVRLYPPSSSARLSAPALLYSC
jgi:ankyrin repeat protein